MSTAQPTVPRRKRVPGSQNSNVYVRPDGKYEIGYRDSTSVQRWRGPFDTITSARAERDSILGAKGKGARVQPNPKLRFGEAADRWLAEQVSDLRPTTEASYRNSIDIHLRPRWGRRRMDTITTDDAARLVRELRAEGKAETTIATILRAAARTFKFAKRRMGWHGENPVTGLESGERPKLSQTTKRRIFRGGELAATINAANEPFRLLFSLAAVTGARISELLGLVWSDVDLADAGEATVSFAYQLDRKGKRVPLKTEESRRTVEIPRQLAAMLLEHKASSAHSLDGAFLFATRSGRAIAQRNVLRELRRAMRAATDAKGRFVFPILREQDERGRPLKVPRGAVPNFHSFRHTAASEAIAAGDGAEEVSWQLGHRNSNVTRAVYVQEIKSTERRAQRRAKMEARYGSLLGGADHGSPQRTEPNQPAAVADLRAVAAGGGNG